MNLNIHKTHEAQLEKFGKMNYKSLYTRAGGIIYRHSDKTMSGSQLLNFMIKRIGKRNRKVGKCYDIGKEV